MRRTGLALWGAWGLLSLAACGDGGSARGLAPAGFGYGVDDDTTGSATEPSGSRTEQPSSSTEAASCGAESVMTLSEAIRLVTVPLCDFEESCSEQDVRPPEDDEPTPNGGGTQTRSLQTSFQDVPEFCVTIAVSRAPGLTQEDECELLRLLAEVAEDVPGCQQHVTLPRGVCAATFAQCIDELVTAGCAAYRAGLFPSSCALVSELE